LRETNVDEEGHAIPFDLSDVKRHVEANDDIKDNVKGPLLAAIGELGSLRLFAKRDYPRAKDLVKPGKLCVVDLSAITNQRKKQMIVASMGGKLFSHRRNGKICPFLMVVEEAHNFAPEQTRKGTSAAASRAAIEKIAREGRKFGACLCLISQRPAHLSSTALAQCNTFCILRVTNPNDIDHIGQSCEAMDSGALGQITTLRVGEGVILGEAVSSPVFVKFRNQKIIKAGKHGALEEIAKKFEEGGTEIADADVEAFI
jgi:DNA helicase HerA-like ATPase